MLVVFHISAVYIVIRTLVISHNVALAHFMKLFDANAAMLN